MAFCLGLGLATGFSGPVSAGEADIEKAVSSRESDGSWRFSVTVRHGDTGWDHFADKWDIVHPDGSVIATRVLAHPHETEQPFTRSLSGVSIDDSVEEVTIRAHDNVHGYGGTEVTIPLKR